MRPLFFSSLKKDRWGVFETDEGGPEKQLSFFPIWLKFKLERAVDGAPSQISTLKLLTPPAPCSPITGHDLGNRMKILFNMFSIFYLWEHTQNLV